MDLKLGNAPPIYQVEWDDVERAVETVAPSRPVALVSDDGSYIRAEGARLMYKIEFYAADGSGPQLVGRQAGEKVRGKATLQDDFVIISPLEYWSHDGVAVFRSFFLGDLMRSPYTRRDPRKACTAEEIRAAISGKRLAT